MPQQLRTAGDLRGFLADVLVGIRDGTIDANKANAISKVAAQINQSLSTELVTAMKVRDAGGGEPAPGSLTLGSTEIAPERDPQPSIVTETNIHSLALPGAKMWCDQCERNVTGIEAGRCGSTFCKAKAAA